MKKFLSYISISIACLGAGLSLEATGRDRKKIKSEDFVSWIWRDDKGSVTHTIKLTHAQIASLDSRMINIGLASCMAKSGSRAFDFTGKIEPRVADLIADLLSQNAVPVQFVTPDVFHALDYLGAIRWRDNVMREWLRPKNLQKFGQQPLSDDIVNCDKNCAAQIDQKYTQTIWYQYLSCVKTLTHSVLTTFVSRLLGEQLLVAVAWSPDEKFLASASNWTYLDNRMGSTIKIWDVETGDCLKTIDISAHICRKTLSFSPDGMHLLGDMIDDGGVYHIGWNAQTGDKVLVRLLRDTSGSAIDPSVRLSNGDSGDQVVMISAPSDKSVVWAPSKKRYVEFDRETVRIYRNAELESLELSPVQQLFLLLCAQTTTLTVEQLTNLSEIYYSLPSAALEFVGRCVHVQFAAHSAKSVVSEVFQKITGYSLLVTLKTGSIKTAVGTSLPVPSACDVKKLSDTQLNQLEHVLDNLVKRGSSMQAIAFFEKYKLELQQSKRYTEFAQIIDKFVRSTGAGSSKGV